MVAQKYAFARQMKLLRYTNFCDSSICTKPIDLTVGIKHKRALRAGCNLINRNSLFIKILH